MNEVSSNATIYIYKDIYIYMSTVYSRKKSFRMLHNIFPKGIQSRTISIDAQYQVFFRNPRDSLQISILARQLCPLNSKGFLEIYKRASHRAYGYLFCCFTQSFLQTKFVIVEKFYPVNIPSCINFNFIMFSI